MGAGCSRCRETITYNPIIEKHPLRSGSNHIQKEQNDNPVLHLNLIPLSYEPQSSNNILDYSHYTNLQKIIVFKNLSHVRTVIYKELVYEGQVDEKNQRHGKGTLKWPNGIIYMGGWANNKANGKGILSFPNSEHYEGMFVENMFEGEGVYIDDKGTKVEGIWRQNNLEGSGSELYAVGHRFEGLYSNGKKNGKGNIIFADGSYFTGKFKENEIYGYGIYIWPKSYKILYQGNWKNNKMNGNGQVIWFISGKMYFGDFLNNKRHGLGIFFWGLQKKWVGYWKVGLREGLGIMIKEEDLKEKGLWNQGKKIDDEDLQIKDDMFEEIESFYERSMKQLFEK